MDVFRLKRYGGNIETLKRKSLEMGIEAGKSIDEKMIRYAREEAGIWSKEFMLSLSVIASPLMGAYFSLNGFDYGFFPLSDRFDISGRERNLCALAVSCGLGLIGLFAPYVLTHSIDKFYQSIGNKIIKRLEREIEDAK